MAVLVAYASKHGATQGIAERIATRLGANGYQSEVAAIAKARDPAAFEAVVLGSAVYDYRWLPEAWAFANHHKNALAHEPLWLFSSGPAGPSKVDSQGRNVLDVWGPKELDDLRAMLHPRDHQMFFGAWTGKSKSGLFGMGKSSWPEGDWRNWPDIDAYADDIALKLREILKAAAEAAAAAAADAEVIRRLMGRR
jgi:menaquinone-dependent protoporphyrinogen oxidase